MGKKPGQQTESTADREKAIAALYFARKCGLTKDEAQRCSGKPRSGSMMKPKSAPVAGDRGNHRSCVAAGRGMIFFTSHNAFHEPCILPIDRRPLASRRRRVARQNAVRAKGLQLCGIRAAERPFGSCRGLEHAITQLGRLKKENILMYSGFQCRSALLAKFRG
ncbi:hypothetical protein EOA13_34130 [Mesorhizobium sp. M7A.F.Ca.US.011.01.1.1]|nr:hypothetical protein EOA13_34130 [Mesorhizobium sp. M7A.F.Ca.US.011.01.1.1]